MEAQEKKNRKREVVRGGSRWFEVRGSQIWEKMSGNEAGALSWAAASQH
jgi:hypothetical protein